jgi:hypothetical protein
MLTKLYLQKDNLKVSTCCNTIGETADRTCGKGLKSNCRKVQLQMGLLRCNYALNVEFQSSWKQQISKWLQFY